MAIGVRRFVYKSFLLVTGFVFCASNTYAHVFVEPTETVIDQQRVISGGQYIAYPLSLETGIRIQVHMSVSGGVDNAIHIEVVNLSNLQLLKSGYRFNQWPICSGRIVNSAQCMFMAPTADLYYVVLDNRSALFKRNVGIRIDKTANKPTARSEQLAATYRARYELLKMLFKFPDLDIHVASCGSVNAFSTPDIVICSELIDDTWQKGVPGAELFAFFHESAHSLLNLWRYPDNDNEDTADQFATVMLILLKREGAARQAAQYAAMADSASEFRTKLYVDDRHSLSIQRARNIIDWLNTKDDLMRRWLRVMIPNMSDSALRELASGAAAHTLAGKDDREIAQLINDEMHRRGITNRS